MQRQSSGERRPAPAPTRLALRHPRAALAAWMAVVAVLTAFGLGIEGHLSASRLSVSGSESARARALIGSSFDEGATVPVLLQGPRADVKRQGKELAATLGRRPGVTVLSPWSTTGRSPLRPSADTALLLLTITGKDPSTTDKRADAVERVVSSHVDGPVHATVTGMPALTRDGVHSSLSAVRRAEAIALPVLLIALLLVFRSPLAAAIPAAFGAATIAAGAGAIRLLADHIALDAFALALASMMGLALAVDYSLLMVSRLREERREDPGADLATAVARAAVPTARTIVAAAAAIVAAMAVAAVLSPGSGVLSAAMGVTTVAVLASVGAALAVPSVLLLWGDHLERFALPGRTHSRGLSARIATASARRPVIGIAAAIALAALAVPAFGLRTGVPSAASLPSDSPARADYERLTNVMGGGWGEPFEIVAVSDRGPVTTPARLAALQKIQDKIAADPDVRAVLGPGAIASSAARLRKAGREAVDAQRTLPRKAGARVGRLDREVSSVATGVGSLRSALAGATSAAQRIGAGSSSVEHSIGALQEGLRGAGSGAQRLSQSIAAARTGAHDVAVAVASASKGAGSLRKGANKLSSGLHQIATSNRDLQSHLKDRSAAITLAQTSIRAQRANLDKALLTALAALTGTDSATTLARAAVKHARQILADDPASGLDAPLNGLGQDAGYAGSIANATPETQARDLASATGQIVSGLGQLNSRLQTLDGSVNALGSGAGALTGALSKLHGGAGNLGNGLGALRAGVDGLTRGVRDGARRSDALAGGLSDAQSAVRQLDGPAAKTTGDSKDTPSQTASSGFFDSGYFLLAALEGGGTAVPFGVNVDRGGQGARIVVVPRYGLEDPRTIALYKRLRQDSGQLGHTMTARTAVGGSAAMLIDYNAAVSGRLPLIVLILSLVSAALLGVLLRSIVVPLIGVMLNLLAVGATLGLLRLLFQGDSPLLGGPGEIDTVALTAIFGVAFALSIDYQVFIIARVREQWLAGADEATAVRRGLSRTARVVTGAALSMLGVFIAFAMADVASVRQFGVGLAIAVAIDATLVRLVLLPAALRLAGRWAWWLPRGRRTVRTVAPPLVASEQTA